MSIQQIIGIIKDLGKDHENMLDLSKQKTEYVKKGDMKKLQSLLLEERNRLRLVEQKEKKRIEAVEAWFHNHRLETDERTVTNILERLENKQNKKELEQASIQLAETIVKLKQQEKLNHDLIEQSMQFVQLSMNLLQPSIENMNYGNKENAGSVKRSVFDSKA